MKNFSSAFTLIEMSIVLTILGLVAAGALTVVTRDEESDKKIETERRLNYVLAQLKRYIRFHGYAPCPAFGSDLITNQYFGIARSAGVNNCDPSSVSQETAEVTYGVVPILDLGLSDQYMFDAWGNRITYAVTQSFTMPGGTAPNAILAAWVGSINIQDAVGNSYLDANQNGIDVTGGKGEVGTAEGAVLALISHGANGHGAWAYKGGAKINRFGAASAPSHTLEEDNGNVNTTPVNNIISITEERKLPGADPVNNNAHEIFDDIVLYLTKMNICVDSRGSLNNGSLAPTPYCAP